MDILRSTIYESISFMLNNSAREMSALPHLQGTRFFPAVISIVDSMLSIDEHTTPREIVSSNLSPIFGPYQAVGDDVPKWGSFFDGEMIDDYVECGITFLGKLEEYDMRVRVINTPTRKALGIRPSPQSHPDIARYPYITHESLLSDAEELREIDAEEDTSYPEVFASTVEMLEDMIEMTLPIPPSLPLNLIFSFDAGSG